MQRYLEKWHKAVPGLDEFAHRLQIPEDARLKILGGLQAPRIYQCADLKLRKADEQENRSQTTVIRSAWFTTVDVLCLH